MIEFIPYQARRTPLIDAMHRHRKRVFVDAQGWDVPVIDGLEIDQFDRDGAGYLIAANEDGAHLASLRLLPTERPHLLDSVFPELCPAGVPRGPAVVEISRLLTAPGLAPAERRGVRERLVVALVEHALGAGISRFTCMANTGWLNQILAMGWQAELLGSPQIIGGEAVGAVALTADTAILAHFRAAWDLPGPQLGHRWPAAA